MEQLTQAMPETSKASPAISRKLLAFGTGVGMEIGPDRPGGGGGAGAARPGPGAGAADDRGLRHPSRGGVGRRVRAVSCKRCGRRRASATVLLPRRDVIVRQLSLPGVAAKDMEGAIRFQLETLHPYSERGCGLGLVGAGLRRGAGRDRAALYHRPLRASCSWRRHRGAQFHLLGGGGACRHPAEWRRARRPGSWR